jgi:O-Antigen ligase
MPDFTPEMNCPGAGVSEWPARTEPVTSQPGFTARAAEALRPNVLVRWAFYLSVFAIPFSYLYLPGTGGRIGVLRIVQMFILCGILSQPRVCLRLAPTALFWFLGYIAMRILWGLWLTPEMVASWWPSSREFLEFLPWVWVMFNVLQFPDARRGGLWALGLGCSLCALFHIAGIGVTEVANGLDNRSSVFGVNANELGATYATAMVALLWLWLVPTRTLSQRLLPFPLFVLIGIAMAKTGSRTAIFILAIGILVLLFFGKTLGSKLRRLACLLLLGAVVAVIVWQIPTVMERFEELNPHNIGEHNPRARMAPVLWEMFLRSPLYGLGPDSYHWELTRRAMPYLFNEGMLIDAHNLLLQLLVETGIIGLLLFSLGVKAALLSAWKARLNSCGPLPLALLLPIVISGATISLPSYHPAFWLATAYALAGAA